MTFTKAEHLEIAHEIATDVSAKTESRALAAKRLRIVAYHLRMGRA